MDVWFTVSGPLAKEGEFPAFAALYHYNTNMSSPQLVITGNIKPYGIIHTKLCIFKVAATTQRISITNPV